MAQNNFYTLPRKRPEPWNQNHPQNQIYAANFLYEPSRTATPKFSDRSPQTKVVSSAGQHVNSGNWNQIQQNNAKNFMTLPYRGNNANSRIPLPLNSASPSPPTSVRSTPSPKQSPSSSKSIFNSPFGATRRVLPGLNRYLSGEQQRSPSLTPTENVKPASVLDRYPPASGQNVRLYRPPSPNIGHNKVTARRSTPSFPPASPLPRPFSPPPNLTPYRTSSQTPSPNSTRYNQTPPNYVSSYTSTSEYQAPFSSSQYLAPYKSPSPQYSPNKIYDKSSIRNSMPNFPPPSPITKPFTPSPEAGDDNFVANRFRYPATPAGTLGRQSWSQSPETPRQASTLYPSTTFYTYEPKPPAASSEARTKLQSMSPKVPPPPPTSSQIPTPMPVESMRLNPPPPPKRAPVAPTTNGFVRQPSFKVNKRDPVVSSCPTGHPPPVPKRKVRPINQPSKLLSPAENSAIFEILGRGRQTLSSAVVQLLLPSEIGDYFEEWIIEEVVILCFVRDSPKRSYFLEFLSLQDQMCIYSCEIYEEFTYTARFDCSFLTFEGIDSMVGVNFADSAEFVHFTDTLDKKIEARKHRRQDRESRLLNSVATVCGDDSKSNGLDRNSKSKKSKSSKVKKSKSFFNTFSMKKRKELTKSDISAPTQFQHVSHAGFHPSRGFESYGLDAEVFGAVMEKVHIPKRLSNKSQTAQLIRSVVETYKPVDEMYETESKPKNPPPPPPRITTPSNPRRERAITYVDEPEVDYHEETDNQQWEPLEAPVIRSPTQKTSTKSPPPPPPTASLHKGPASFTPPIPPPMPPSDIYNTSDLQVINTSTRLPTPPADYDLRSNLLREIQEGPKLKHVDQSQARASYVDGLAGALQKALDERARVMHSDSDSESDSAVYDSEDWEDD